jgi:hypothetical protein
LRKQKYLILWIVLQWIVKVRIQAESP